MKRIFYLIIAITTLFTLTACGDTSTATDNYPSKAITLIVPYAAGGSNDLIARIMSEALAKEISVPVVVENKPGASGEIGWSECYNATPDGYTIAITSAPNMIINPLTDSVSYDYREYEYLMAVCDEPRVLVASADMRIDSLEDLLAYAKDNRVIIGNSGSFGYYISGDFARKTSLRDFSLVPYDGDSELLLSVVSRDSTVGIPSVTSINAMAEFQRIKILCVLWNERLQDYPDIPTAAELGYPDLVYTATRGFIAPPNTPQEICDILTDAMYRAVERDDYKEAEANLGLTRNILSGEEFKAQMERDYENYARLVELEESWNN